MKRGPKALPSRSKLPTLKPVSPAEDVIRFFRTRLTHVKGELAGRRLKLAPWQCRDIITPLFDTKREDGLRQYRTCYVEIPRKNTKSTLAAGLALYLLYADGEPGAEIISAAADRQQAAIVFDIAKSMVEASPKLRDMAVIYRREIVIPSTGSVYRVISSEAYSKHGMNLHGAMVDELHAHESRELLDVLQTSMGARRQPLLFIITTAGHDRQSVCWEFHQHAERVKQGTLIDPSFLPVLYGAPVEADWSDPAVWAAANPGLGMSLKRDYLEQECRRAQEMPGYQNQFRRWHLNQWTESATVWLPMDWWDRGAVAVDREALRGRRCYAGLDLSTTTDLSALVLVFPDEEGGYDILPFAWCPRDNILKRSRADRVPYEAWARDGYLEATEGNVVDYDVIRERLKALAILYDIREIAYDRWGATQLVTQLQDDGATVVPVGQGYQSLSAPSKELEKLVRGAALRHGGHPVLRWCVANAMIEQDPAGNIKPSKRKSTERIDLLVALVMALDRASRSGGGASIYETRGVLAL